MAYTWTQPRQFEYRNQSCHGGYGGHGSYALGYGGHAHYSIYALGHGCYGRYGHCGLGHDC